jgi:hypothetical protein
MHGWLLLLLQHLDECSELLACAPCLSFVLNVFLRLVLRRFFLGTWNMAGFLSENRPIRTLREILTRLRETYCGNTGFEVGAALVLPWPSWVE